MNHTSSQIMSFQRRASSDMHSGFQVIFERPDRPSPSPPLGEPAFRPRRYHTKSRNGCFNCKRRRIKCDEAQPDCTHCFDKGLQCEYPTTRRSPPPSSASPSPTSSQPSNPRRRSSQWSERSVTDLSTILDYDDVPSPTLVQQGYRRSDVVMLFDHFIAPTSTYWIGCPMMQEVIQEHVVKEGSQTPYLLYSALAFSAAHMHHLNPRADKYRAAALYHYQQSLEKYSAQLGSTFAERDAESLFASCLLHAYLAFLYSPFSHIGKPSADNIEPGWVRSMQGATFITQSPVLMSGLRRGRFKSFLDHCEVWRNEHEGGNANSSPRASENMRQLFALAKTCSTADSRQQEMYSEVLSLLRDLARLKPRQEIVGSFVIMINELPASFMDLLQAAEPRALLIIAFWCALFSRIDQWWIANSARAECQRICEYVEGLGEMQYDGIIGYLRGVCE